MSVSTMREPDVWRCFFCEVVAMQTHKAELEEKKHEAKASHRTLEVSVFSVHSWLVVRLPLVTSLVGFWLPGWITRV